MKLAINMLLVTLALGLGPRAVAAETAPGDVKFAELTVAESLTGQPGSAEEGAKTFKDRRLGNCLACHANKDMAKELFQGNVGPVLDGVAGRYQPDQLRAILVNAKTVFGAETTMPGFYTLEAGKDVAEDFVGKTILSAQQVEDVIAYLTTLKE